jgi:hypothetical protein
VVLVVGVGKVDGIRSKGWGQGQMGGCGRRWVFILHGSWLVEVAWGDVGDTGVVGLRRESSEGRGETTQFVITFNRMWKMQSS